MSGGLKDASSSLKKMGDQMQDVGKKMSVGLTAPIVGAGVAMFKAFADYEDVLAEIEARTGATSDEMAQLSKVAKEMGRDTVFSASEAAQAMLELTSSGSSAAEAMEAIPSILNLAAAGALDLGVAADGVTDVIKQFKLSIEDSVMVTDELARAAGSSSATIADLLQGFGNVGPVASQFGFSVSQTAAALAVLAENGVKGAEAGTQLRSMLLNMTNDTNAVRSAWKTLGVSMYDASGNMRNIDDVFKDINAAMDGLPIQQQIELGKKLAGSYGIIGFNSLRAANGISDMQASMLNAASAEDVASARMNTLSGHMKSMMGSIETLAITLGGLGAGPLKDFIGWITGVINAFTQWAEANPQMAQIIMLIAGLVAAAGPLLIIIGSLISAIATISAALPALAAGFGLLLSPIGALVGIGALLYAAWATNFLGVQDIVNGFVAFITTALRVLFTGDFMGGGGFEEDSGIAQFLFGLRKAIVETQQVVSDSMAKIGAALSQGIGNASTAMKTGVDSWGGIFKMMGAIFKRGQDTVVMAMTAIVNAIKATLSGVAQMVKGIAMNIMGGLIEGIKSRITEWIDTMRKMAQGAANAVKNALGIKSPSKVMANMGKQVVAGFTQGIDSMGGLAIPQPQMAGATSGSSATMGSGLSSGGGFGGAGVYINTLNVPPGTTQEQIEFIAREIGKRAKRLGGKGGL